MNLEIIHDFEPTNSGSLEFWLLETANQAPNLLVYSSWCLTLFLSLLIVNILRSELTIG